jgi:tRNA-splicing ligase RtcB
MIARSVGVDIGCGMCAVRTSLTSHAIPDDLKKLFDKVARAVPHGSSKGSRDVGAWHDVPDRSAREWRALEARYDAIVKKHPKVAADQAPHQMGTLGGGNHFVEVCIDESDRVWLMLHSGSRGVGNRVGAYFTELAKKDMERLDRRLPSKDLAYLTEGTEHFHDYVEAMTWAQDYASKNREVMVDHALAAMKQVLPAFTTGDVAVNCHHNYASKETHFGRELYVTRKGAVSARAGELGIIPGSMGTRSFIVRGKGNAESFHSCSHGAGRVMARGEAKRTITLEQHAADTAGVACRKDEGVIDESPRAYKNIDDVMRAQNDLVEVVHTLKQVLCVKG